MPRLLLLLVYLVLSSLTLPAQNGFLQTYELYPGRALSLHQILSVEDTLVVCGIVVHPELPQQGLFFAKLDTLGQLLDYRTHYDSAGYNYVFERTAKMIKTADGGYALVGGRFEGSIPLIFRLDASGNLLQVWEYPDTTTLTKWHRSIVELLDGSFVSIGYKQQASDYLLNGFVMKVDTTGHKEWEINYGEEGLHDVFTTVQTLSNDEILVTGGYWVDSGTVNPNEDAWFRSLAVKLDNDGQIIWEWQSDSTMIGTGFRESLGSLSPADDGGWLNLAIEDAIQDVLGEPTVVKRGCIVKRDADFNMEWYTPFGEMTTTTNRFADLAPTPDGGWVAVGSYFTVLNYDIYEGYHSGMIAKINAQGDSLWSRLDSISGSKPELASVVVLPSGSIVACGRYDRFVPEPFQTLGWIVKVDRDGCFEPGCRIVNGLDPLPEVADWELYPNPAHDLLRIEADGRFELYIYGLDGKQYQEHTALHEQVQIDISTLPNGIYFAQLRQGHQWSTQQFVKQ